MQPACLGAQQDHAIRVVVPLPHLVSVSQPGDSCLSK